MTPSLNDHQLQFDFFSSNYQQFEKDFYKYSALTIPLVFLESDILKSMAASQRNYFCLHHSKSKDHRDHYFHFAIESRNQTPLTRIYTYMGHSLTPE